MKRIYEKVEVADGYRILVDRLWPRGIKKETAKLDQWMKSVTPSPELRKWFGHDPDKFDVFSKKYREELTQNPEKREGVDWIRQKSKEETVTLVYAAKDPIYNHVKVLKAVIEERK